MYKLATNDMSLKEFENCPVKVEELDGDRYVVTRYDESMAEKHFCFSSKAKMTPVDSKTLAVKTAAFEFTLTKAAGPETNWVDNRPEKRFDCTFYSKFPAVR